MPAHTGRSLMLRAQLCAAGTVGIAATGFALATEDDSTYIFTPGKRKWPGASSVRSPSPRPSPSLPRRAISQPGTSHGPRQDQAQTQTLLSTSYIRKRRIWEDEQADVETNGRAESRESSLNRSGMLRPRTAHGRSTSEKRDASTGSSWLKRISTVSSLAGSSAASSVYQTDASLVTGPRARPMTSYQSMPNKLVKRSMSQRGLSHDQAKGSFFRRPATSHRRDAMLHDLHQQELAAQVLSNPVEREPLPSEGAVPSSWRPFFERSHTNKRHSLPATGELNTLRTISASRTGPMLMLGSSLEQPRVPKDRENENQTKSAPASSTSLSTGKQRLRRSISSMHRASRRRFFTDPVTKVADDTVNGTISPAIKQSPISPLSHTSTFEVDLPHSSPALNSSPPFISVRHRFSFRKRQSTAPSDPTTLSSDNDTRVFTDDDSMDFQSDTAYDSLATRATASSHSAMQPSKLNTIFDQTGSSQAGVQGLSLERLMQQATLNEHDTNDSDELMHEAVNHGIGIRGIDHPEHNFQPVSDESATLTPVKSRPFATDDVSITPIAIKPWLVATHDPSSPLQPVPESALSDSSAHTSPAKHKATAEVEDHIDWSPKSESEHSTVRPELPTGLEKMSADLTSQLDMRQSRVQFGMGSNEPDRRMSIFDWSENQRLSDTPNGGEARPKTVHGKQVHDNARSRSSGRKAPNPMHLRSQSVPNNREAQTEATPLPASKFGTWGLGHKPVSEEWSDDFEFDDLEEEENEIPLALPVASSSSEARGSVKGVKVPQSIIDRQASVHVQFGQVQEFMMLVEELKRLRIRGADLNLLEHDAKHLWEDAESIINLATINDEEDEFGHLQTQSPPILDVFGDDTSMISRAGNTPNAAEYPNHNTGFRRSLQGPATPPHGRPRGESLAQAKSFLQSIHQSRSGIDSSPLNVESERQNKLPFDTQDLKDLVVRSAAITRSLKDVVREAEGVSVSPAKTPPRYKQPLFSQIFNVPEASPCPPFRKPGLPKSKSANSYLSTSYENNHNTGDVSTPYTLTAMV